MYHFELIIPNSFCLSKFTKVYFEFVIEIVTNELSYEDQMRNRKRINKLDVEVTSRTIAAKHCKYFSGGIMLLLVILCSIANELFLPHKTS